jgi:hypothetical protein
MIFFLAVVAMTIIFIACAFLGPVAVAVVIATLACLIAGLTGCIIGTLVGTNVLKINYEVAFRRGFVAATALAATVMVTWTAVLDLLAGGLTGSLVANLTHVAYRCAAGSFLVTVVTMVTWGVLVFRSGRKNRG